MDLKFGWLIILLMVLPYKLVKTDESPPNELHPSNLLSLDFISPDSYEVNISSYLDKQPPYYNGEVVIKIHCLRGTKIITLNQVGFNLKREDITVQKLTENGEPTKLFIPVQNLKPVSGDRLEIELGIWLVIQKYEIKIRFVKDFDVKDSAGYILKTYQDIHHGVIKYMTFTKVNEFDARRIFPCLDQINMKTNFKLSLSHHRKFTAFSNMSYRSENVLDNPDWVQDVFHETENISTFSIAIALASFQSTGFDYLLNVNVQTWGHEYIIHQAASINVIASRIFKFFSNLFKLPHPMGKLDILIVPDVDFQVQESFGIIFMSNEYVLDILNKKSDPLIFDIISRICHAVSYQWIGNTVTMFKWQDHWLHQGFNSFLQAECIKNVFPEHKSNVEFNLIESFTNFFKNEETCEYEPISVLKSYPDYHPMSYMTAEKAHFLIRMMHFILGPSLFYARLAKYVAKFKNKNAHLIEVLSVFSDHSDSNESNILPESSGIRTVIESWLDERWIPLLIVQINRETKFATVKQKVYDLLALDPEKKGAYEKCWQIPLSYTTTKNLKFDEISPSIWSVCDESVEFPTGDLDPDDWVLVNLELNVPGRVMYEQENWINIQNYLLDKEEYENISVLTRVRVVSDMFSLAEAGILSYQFVFQTIVYLEHEEAYAVWNVAFKEIDKIRSLLLRTDIFKAYQKFVRTILEPVFLRTKFQYLTVVPKENIFDSQFEVLLIKFSCKFDVKGCNDKCSELFRTWNTKFSLRHSVYKTALCESFKNGNDDTFNSFWKKLAENRVANSNEDILEAFSCSPKDKTLETLLKQTITNKNMSHEDRTNIIRFLPSHKSGYKLMMKFYQKNYDAIKLLHLNLSYMRALLDATNNDEDLNELSKFANEKRIPLSDKLTRKSMRNARRNAMWTSRNKQALKIVLCNMKLC